jgi:hypothetical protein
VARGDSCTREFCAGRPCKVSETPPRWAQWGSDDDSDLQGHPPVRICLLMWTFCRRTAKRFAESITIPESITIRGPGHIGDFEVLVVEGHNRSQPPPVCCQPCGGGLVSHQRPQVRQVSPCTAPPWPRHGGQSSSPKWSVGTTSTRFGVFVSGLEPSRSLAARACGS